MLVFLITAHSIIGSSLSPQMDPRMSSLDTLDVSEEEFTTIDTFKNLAYERRPTDLNSLVEIRTHFIDIFLRQEPR